MTVSKDIVWLGRPCTLGCDGQCSKAWGINGRPTFTPPDSRNEDDFALMADGELGDAPVDPGTYEGGEGKVPLSMNKWCARECERSTIAERGQPLRLVDFTQRRWNMADRRTAVGGRDGE